MNSDNNDILIIDDSKENLRVLADILTHHGYKVRPSLDGSAALMAAFTEPPDLILLDIMMPHLNGYELCAILKADPRTHDIPVIFISALNEVFDKVQAFTIGGIDYITKPFQIEEVLARVKTHLALRFLQISLKTKNEELNQTLETLKATQSQLIEAEKMAALGRLVAGLAHEINTPLGTAITVASMLHHDTEVFESALQGQALKKSVLTNYCDRAKQSSQILLSNLQRTGELVQSFKQIAVDQSYLDRQVFRVKSYLEQILISLSPQLKATPHTVKITGDETLEIESYPGAFAQIITNLLMNSLTHAYQPGQAGHITLDVQRQDNSLRLYYQDDGCGISPENLSKIFEPFFTTARPQGGSGLGLHLVYNLVTQKLQGQIHCISQVDEGTKFILDLPL